VPTRIQFLKFKGGSLLLGDVGGKAKRAGEKYRRNEEKKKELMMIRLLEEKRPRSAKEKEGLPGTTSKKQEEGRQKIL